MRWFRSAGVLLIGLGLLGSGRAMAQSPPRWRPAPMPEARLRAVFTPSTLPMPVAKMPSNPGLRIPSSRFATPILLP